MSRIVPRAGFPVGEDHEWCDGNLKALGLRAEKAETHLACVHVMLADLARDIRDTFPQWAQDLRDEVVGSHEPACEVRRWFDKPGFGPKARCLCAEIRGSR